MLKQLIAFETRYHCRQLGFWVIVGIMFLFGVGIISMPDASYMPGTGQLIKANGAGIIATITASLSLASIFFGAVFVVSGVLRDRFYKSLEIIHATAVSTRNMTLSRMIGVYVASFLCVFALTVGLFAGQFMPWMDAEALGPVNPIFFLQPALVFIAINTLLVSGVFTAIAAFTHNRSLVYVSAIGLFVLKIMAELFVGQDASELLISLADPFGSSALAITTKYWSAVEQNTLTASLNGYIGLNRLLWGSVGLALYFVSFGLFKRGLVCGKTNSDPNESDAEPGLISITPVVTSITVASVLKMTWARFKHEYLTTVISLAFVILTLLTIALFALVIYIQMVFVVDPALPTSRLVLTTVFNSLAVPLMIIMVFFSGEIIWRDKTAGITEILDASPVKNGCLMAGKWLALIGVVITIIGLGMVVGMIAQTLLGDIPINLLTYLSLGFVSLAPKFVLFCILIMFVQNFMPNRVAGMLASAATLVFFFIVVNLLPFAHPLMLYGSIHTGGWSEINGYSNLIWFRWFLLYWGFLASLLVVLSIWLWRRGTHTSLLARVKSLSQSVGLPTFTLAILFFAGFVGTGTYIYKAFNIDNELLSRKQRDLKQVKFEQLFAEALKQAIPKIRAIEVNAVFNPRQQTAIFSGTYILENTTAAPLDEVYISQVSEHDTDIRVLKLAGATAVTTGLNSADLKAFGLRLYRFEPPLAVDARTTLTFETFFRAPSLGKWGLIERNGTFVNNFEVLPQFGVRDLRLTDTDKRRIYKLPKLEKRADRMDIAAHQINLFGATADYVDFNAKVCTDIGQTPITSGEMVREYQKDGKACRTYRATRPIANFFSFLSIESEVNRDIWVNPNGEDVPLAIYYHKTHDYNVTLMTEAMKASLDTYTSQFGPYQYHQIRIVEFPYGNTASSFAATIPFSENHGFVKDPGDPEDNKNMDLASYVVMHEVAHQWFGHQIMAANTKGYNVLSEGLSENAAMTAYESRFGWQKTRRVLEARAIQKYLTRRTKDREPEPPLAKAEDQRYLNYNKASWVFWGLKQYIGEELMQGAIRDFLEEYGSKGPPYPTSVQLIDYLRAVAPDEMQGLITDYWERITFWALQMGDDVEVKENGSGGYRVQFSAIVDKRIASEETGKETSVTDIDGEGLNEWVEIGFYKNDPKHTLGGDWFHLERVLISKKETELRFTLQQYPDYILLDPRRLLIERKVEDNVNKLKPETAQ